MTATPLFGRAEPLAACARALDAMAEGKGGALVVAGEAGIGKTALVRALADEAETRGARVAFGRAWEVGGAPAYWPWSQALRALGLDLDELLGSNSGEMASAQRVVAWHRVIRAVCEPSDAPLVMILDDLHAADIASAELALAFARAAQRERALLVVTTRETELRERRELGELVAKLTREGVALPLRRLEASETASWLTGVGFRGDAAEVHRLSEGNPLFIEEAVRLGVDRFATAATGGVAVILAEHLTRMSPGTHEVLALASVFGREASPDDVAALGDVGADEVGAAAREGRLAGVLSPASQGDGAIAFAHVLLRDSLYGTLMPSRRAALHARVGALLEARGAAPAVVARHLLAARKILDPRRVAQTVCRAAEEAIARHASDSAIEMLANARALLTTQLDEPTALVLDLAQADASMRNAPSDGARSLAADCAARAWRLGLAAEHARAALVYGHEVLSGRVDPRMVGLLEDALARVPSEERTLRAQLLARLAAALTPPSNAEQMERAITFAREAIAIVREIEDVPARLHTLAWSTTALTHVLPIHERVELTSELVSLARQHGADVALADIGGLHAVSLREGGQPVAARHEAEAYLRLMASLPLPALRWKATALEGTMAALDGRLDEARRCAEELRRSGGPSHAVVAWAFFEVALCACTRDADRLREIEGELTPILAQRPVLEPLRAVVAAVVGRRDEARAHLKPIVHISRAARGLLVQAEAAVLLGSAELAASLYDPLAEAAPFGRFFWGPAGTLPFGPVSRLLGELALLRGDHARARGHLDAAIAECRDMEPFLALAREARARCADERPSPMSRAPESRRIHVELSREGDVWRVASGSSAPFRVKHAKGMAYLDHLLRTPGREVYALVLAGAEEGPEDGGAVLDGQARRAYAQRAEDLEDQLSEAERFGDRGRASRAREELEALAEALASAVGLGGRDRKAASNVERARVNVRRRLRDAISRIGEHDVALGRYLDASVRTGTYCVYTPV